MCDKAVHIHCLDPPMQTIPQQNWFCKDCVNCLSCDKFLGNIQSKSQGLWYEGVKRICKECHQLYQQGNFCKICMTAYSEDSNEDFVQCDSCELWIHAKCDSINKEKLARLEQNDEKYLCPLCRKNNKNPKTNTSKKKK